MGWCSQSFNVKSKLYAWTKAAFGGRDIPPDWDLDCDKLLNREVLLVVAKVEGQRWQRVQQDRGYAARAPGQATGAARGEGSPPTVNTVTPLQSGQTPNAQQPAVSTPAAVSAEPLPWLDHEASPVEGELF